MWPHANILTAHSVIDVNGIPFLLLNYAEHGSLRELLEHPERMERRGQRGQAGPGQIGGRLPLGTALDWAQQIAAGLVALHTPDPEHLRPLPIVHRDLKPENVLVNEYGGAQITDFGLAKVLLDADVAEFAEDLPPAAAGPGMVPTAGVAVAPADTAEKAGKAANMRSQRYRTQRGAAMGTLAYMAPEQWVDAASAGTAADLYAFGLILSELLAGRHALLDLDLPLSQEQWRLAHFQGAPRPLRAIVPELPAVVEDLYGRLLAKRAEERPTAAEALAVLQQAAAALGEPLYTPSDVFPHTPDHEQAYWHNLSIVYHTFGLYGEALALNSRALIYLPSNWRLLTTRGNILDSLGRDEEALTAYDGALTVVPTDDLLAQKTIWINRGSCLSRLEQYGEAEEAFQHGVALRSDAADVWFYRAINQRYWGVARYLAGDIEGAKACIKQAIEFSRRTMALDPAATDPPRLLAVVQQFADIQLEGV